MPVKQNTVTYALDPNSGYLEPGMRFYPQGDTILTPVFEPVGYYTVTFEAGGASGSLPTPITVKDGQAVTIPGLGSLANGDAFFNGWRAVSTGLVYHKGNRPVFVNSTTLVAQWVTLEGGETF